ncbi:PTS sugar transporter subunit IIA [Paenibacillus jilunlii]|uniref:PTS glucose transporter subunit IIA n=1 Tax=Paenibacillus jilunlii TaxID=682956 RepID=A0A1G9HF42_9BACL|nr:PTS glucose transporter subunit IIA [Paenibacillus jilunlii]KWX69655.1 PTS glucose transporter subunit IIA [Paenibacillus jilunlii]SDL11651.1 PTS system, glucose-specific IIA component [Paenibacillus jilunlii]
MFSKWKSKKEAQPSKLSALEISAPVTGQAVSLTGVPDETFSGGHMGQGIAIKPSEGKLIAPFDGIIAHVVKSNHAVIIEHASGLQLLLHIGIDTVSLKGSGFISYVASGDEVKAGQTLIEFDMASIQAAGYQTITPVIVTSNGETEFEVACHYGSVTAGKDMILTVASRQ